MTDYAKWDRFVAEIESESDEDEVSTSRIGSEKHVQKKTGRGDGEDGNKKALDSMKSPLEFSLISEKISETLKTEQNYLKHLKEKKKENNRTLDTLKFIPKRTRHKIMVPMGKLAFYEGELVHTNEVLVKMNDVLLERTPEQTIEILQRRQQGLDVDISKLESSVKSLENSLELTMEATTSNFIDIYEEYDEEFENETQRILTRQVQKKEIISNEEHDAIMHKLDRLERLEEQAETEAKLEPVLAEMETSRELNAKERMENMMNEIDNSERAFSGLVQERSGNKSKQTNEEKLKEQPKKKSLFKMSRQRSS